MSESILIPAILVFIAAGLGTLAVALVFEGLREWWRRRQVAKRVRPVLTGRARKSKAIDDLVRGEQDGAAALEALGRILPSLRRVESLLEQSRVDWSPWTFLILSVGLALALGLAGLLIGGSLIWFALAAAAGACVPYFYINLRRSWRLARFEEEFPEGIDLLTRAIRAGHPLSSSMGMVADEGPAEVSIEFRQVFEEQRFGIPFEEALLGMVDRLGMMDVRIFAIAVLVQREVGGNLAETLDNLAQTIRKRFYLRRQLKVYTAQGRLTGYALAVLPIVVSLGIYFITPDYITLLFIHPAGKMLLGIALGLQVLGVLWIRKIINIDM